MACTELSTLEIDGTEISPADLPPDLLAFLKERVRAVFFSDAVFCMGLRSVVVRVVPSFLLRGVGCDDAGLARLVGRGGLASRHKSTPISFLY